VIGKIGDLGNDQGRYKFDVWRLIAPTVSFSFLLKHFPPVDSNTINRAILLIEKDPALVARDNDPPPAYGVDEPNCDEALSRVRSLSEVLIRDAHIFICMAIILFSSESEILDE
jgi:hypothetical protein